MNLKILWLMVGSILLSLASCSKCPNSQLCGERQTCCQISSSGEQNCCPFHQGECCEDHLHCCPEGMLCQLSESKCSNSTLSIPWVKRVPAKQSILAKSFRMISSSDAIKDNLICPDNSSCPAEYSCLKLSSKFGCCPVPQGIVCSDGKHCCPKDHECSIDSLSCNKKKEPLREVMCGDGLSECPMETSCCETAEGTWGCCPMPNAVCCDDKVHCCPEGSVCHVNSSKCVSSSNLELPMWAKFPARLRADWEDSKPVVVTPKTTTKPATTTTPTPTPKTTSHSTIVSKGLPKISFGSDVPCNDSVACPDGNTCCKNLKGEWACCPLPEAVCCEDKIHCCPKGSTCKQDQCESPSGSVPLLKKQPSRPRGGKKLPTTNSSDVPCDDTVACPDGNTCCKNLQNEWACCPLPEAVCCEDKIHCCPKGSTCKQDQCESPSGSVPLLKKQPSRPRGGKKLPTTNSSDVPCDDTVACPDGNTCCKDLQNEWACCPLPEAVCCEDKIHCCPKGSTCKQDQCESPSGSVPLLKKQPSRPRGGKKLPATNSSDVPCDDTVACPDGNTCCKDLQNEWACCPLPEAVCCEDKIHCCPKGSTCKQDQCESPSGSVPLLKKQPSRPRGGKKLPTTNNTDVPCDGIVACPDGHTCCGNNWGGWSCCPYPEAVCCDDFIHCCPQGHECNPGSGACKGSSGFVPWQKKKPSRPRKIEKSVDKVGSQRSSGNVSCDTSHSCPESTTCCKNKDLEWRCCPFAEGVCCEDHMHCCPHDTTCNLKTLTCDKGNFFVPMSSMISSSAPTAQVKEKQEKVEENTKDSREKKVQCDKNTSCPDHTTCCFMTRSQKWGCCPLPNAVCCKDGEHCCPAHYTCNNAQTSCIKGDVVIPWYNKLAAQSSSAPDSLPGHSAVRCDPFTQCPVGTSCCQLSTGKWGCCPLYQATCCSDGLHCCPKDYSCQMESGSCVKTIWLQVETLPLTQIRRPDTHCGGRFSCKDTETCCKTSPSTWACCPSPKAVCCSDMKHCCPEGYTCSEGGTCTQATGFNWDHWQIFFSKEKRALRV